MLKRGLGRKGQLTVFIILGMVIFFAFIFMLKIDSQVLKNQLEQGVEDVYSKIFSKEALRLYVEDCLHDELQQAIITIGRQGRIWSEQPGGTVAFLSEANGISVGAEKVAYALRRSNYEENVGAYPCDTFSLGEAPAYCKYNAPSAAKFGEVDYWETNIENDLESSLKVEVNRCLNEYLQQRVANAVFEEKDFVLDIDLKQDGIGVEATYPLGFRVGEEDFFHLSIFDFFYPTQLKKLVKFAMEQPLEKDWTYPDFAFDENFFSAPTFMAGGINTWPVSQIEYNSLGLRLNRERLLTGDTLYSFTSPAPNIVDAPQDYVMQYVRQNRPPALKYISGVDCPTEDYNYLVVWGDESAGGYGGIDITLEAVDPDDDSTGEDNIKYYFSGDDVGVFSAYFKDLEGNLGTAVGDGKIEAQKLSANPEDVKSIPVGVYTIIARAEDAYGQFDEQQILIKIDDTINPDSAVLEIEYPFGPATAFSDIGNSIISKEDPFVIKVEQPDTGVVTVNSLKVSDTSGLETTLNLGISDCLFFPAGTPQSDCTIFPTTLPDINMPLTSTSADYAAIKTANKLSAEFTLNYCIDSTTGLPTPVTTSKELEVENKNCVPYNDNTHDDKVFVSGDMGSFGMAAGLYKKNILGKWEIDSLTNPFSADHVCCNADTGDYQGTSKTCFEAESCTTLDPYRVKTIKKVCAADRGNICGGTLTTSDISPSKCGFPGVMGCSSYININCQDKPAFALIQNVGWCGGNNGCGETPRGGENGWCTGKAVVPKGSATTISHSSDSTGKKYLNNNYKCGCITDTEDNSDVGKDCDSNYDGVADGKCKLGGACSS